MGYSNKLSIANHNERLATDEAYADEYNLRMDTAQEYEFFEREKEAERIERERENELHTDWFSDYRVDFSGYAESDVVEAIIIELIYNNGRGNRNYLLKTVDRKKFFVTVNLLNVRCFVCASAHCQHATAIRQADRERFAADYGERPANLCVSERKVEFFAALERGKNSDMRVLPNSEPDTFVVFNRDSRKEYFVKLASWKELLFAECSCPDFVKRERVCKHVAEVLMFNLFGAA